MSCFICPLCEQPSLEIGHSMSLGADCRSDEIRVQAIACTACSFRGVAAYEESRRGSLDSESWDHRASGLAEPDYLALVELLQACPDRGNERCSCDSHRTLGQRDARDRWVGMSGLKLQAPYAFFMQRSD
jgi:hypothetical protein